ncbi:MAG TPA: NAD-dependent epimerase/dehydratase family protein [Anaerolineales bacterium]
MTKAFVTGGTGFIGQRLVGKLVEQGAEVHALVRSDKGAVGMQAMGAQPVWGDITDKETMRAGMAGCDVVFHLAAWYKLGAPDWRKAEQINVEGTRNVLTLAAELGIPKIIYVSTVAVYGDTHGRLLDETAPRPSDPFLTEYDRTKSIAHFDVAESLIRQGAPMIIAMPGVVYGPGDPSLVGDLMRGFYRGWFPIFPAPDLALTLVHVDDVAEGLLVLAEKGRIGESYILTGPALKLGDLARLWSEVLGRRPPVANIPARLLKPFAPLMAAIEQVVPLPQLFSRDAVAILDATYFGRADKARRELGWRTRSLPEGMRETFDSFAQANRPSLPEQDYRKRVAGLALGAAIGLLLAWLIGKRQKPG